MTLCVSLEDFDCGKIIPPDQPMDDFVALLQDQLKVNILSKSNLLQGLRIFDQVCNCTEFIGTLPVNLVTPI